jgi:hypothetical protein
MVGWCLASLPVAAPVEQVLDGCEIVLEDGHVESDDKDASVDVEVGRGETEDRIEPLEVVVDRFGIIALRVMRMVVPFWARLQPIRRRQGRSRTGWG